jgi:hypothetical protein
MPSSTFIIHNCKFLCDCSVLVDKMIPTGPLLLLLLSALCSPLAAAQSTPTYDFIVIGAGVSGIKAAFDLRQAGRSVLVLEARTRPYGRVDTQQPAGWPMPIEVSKTSTCTAVVAYYDAACGQFQAACRLQLP